MSATHRRPIPAVIADPAFAALKAVIVERTGHHYYADKDEQLGERVALRMAANGIGAAADYLERLSDAALGDCEWRQLESELTIKETFFFRFAEQFAALRDAILPSLVKARAATKRLRIWSAGCSTGAEPYSVAVVLSDLLGATLADWQVSILGTDLDERALAAAREATYGGWSLRTMAAAERERLFVAHDGRWRLKRGYAGMVRFERLNILDLDGSAVPLQLSDYDLILCRNMLIYFHPDQATRLVEAMGSRLAPDGWLLLGHAEAGLAMGTTLLGVEIAGVVGYRRSTGAITSAPGVAAAPRAGAPRVRPASAQPRQDGAARVAAVLLSSQTAPPTGAGGESLDAIRRLLDGGEIAAASEAIARLRDGGASGARLFFLEAMCALVRGERSAGERSLRSALYLDDRFAMAHYLLAQTLMESGRRGAARRALLNAANALSVASPDEPVAEGDGRTAAELREVVMARLSAMEAA